MLIKDLEYVILGKSIRVIIFEFESLFTTLYEIKCYDFYKEKV